MSTHWVVVMDNGLPIDHGYCYCDKPDAPPTEHYPGAGPLRWPPR